MKKIKLILVVLVFCGITISSSEKLNSGKYVTLSGYLSLSGSAYVPSNNSYVTAYLNGWVILRDSLGNYYTANTYVTATANFWASNNYVLTQAYPNTYITVYNKEGKAVGSGYLNQSIGVSGWINGNYVNLNGSGYVSISVYVND